jgi:membrane protein involved in colicin uptake
MTETRQTVNELADQAEQVHEEYRADLKTLRAKIEAHGLAGVLDGFRLARAETQAKAEDVIDEINKADVEARIRAARAEIARGQALDSAAETEPDPPTRPN